MCNCGAYADTMVDVESTHGANTIYDILVGSAWAGLDLQRDDGSFPPGRNYTYDEPETPVRTTSHWLNILTKSFEITAEEQFEEAAHRAIDYLLTDEIRPSGYTYHCRKIDSKDKCNGLVGQAAPIQALTRASDVFDRDGAQQTAEEVFSVHPFDDGLGLWERVEIDGTPLSFDRTLNHQIIFAAAGTGLLPTSDRVESQIERFLDTLQANMRTHADGLIKHYVRPPVSKILRSVLDSPHRYDMLINEAVFHYYSYSKDRRKKERGYQTVNLEALSRLRSAFPAHKFWESEKIISALEFLRANEDELLAGIKTKHGSLIQGVNTAKIRHRFENKPLEDLRHLLTEDIVVETGGNLNVFGLDEVDENTQAALVSSLTDIPDVKIN